MHAVYFYSVHIFFLSLVYKIWMINLLWLVIILVAVGLLGMGLGLLLYTTLFFVPLTGEQKPQVPDWQWMNLTGIQPLLHLLLNLSLLISLLVYSLHTNRVSIVQWHITWPHTLAHTSRKPHQQDCMIISLLTINVFKYPPRNHRNQRFPRKSSSYLSGFGMMFWYVRADYPYTAPAGNYTNLHLCASQWFCLPALLRSCSQLIVCMHRMTR